MPIWLIFVILGASAIVASKAGGGSGTTNGCATPGSLPVPTTPKGTVIATFNTLWILDTAGQWWVAFDPAATVWASPFPKIGPPNPACPSNAQAGPAPTPKPNGATETLKPLVEACNRTYTNGGAGTWWNGQVFFESYEPVPHADGFVDEVTAFVGNTVVPAAIRILAVINPLAGLATATAYEMASNVIQGQSLAGAVLASAIDQIKSQAGSAVAKQAIDQGLADVQGVAPGLYNTAAAAKAFSDANPGLSADELRAYATGAALAQTAQIQQKAIAAIRSQVPPDKQGLFDFAIGKGAALADAARALVPSGLSTFAATIADATKAIDPSIPTVSAAPVTPTRPCIPRTPTLLLVTK